MGQLLDLALQALGSAREGCPRDGGAPQPVGGAQAAALQDDPLLSGGHYPRDTAPEDRCADTEQWNELGRTYLAVEKIRCPVCNSTCLWESIYAAQTPTGERVPTIICGDCHPPADESLVKRWLDRKKES